MAKMLDLSEDLAREILSRNRLTSQRSVRSTCKLWNALSKPATSNQLLGFMTMNSKVCALTYEKSFVDPVINQVSPLDHFEKSKTSYCDGLLLLVTKDTRLLVWSPYLNQLVSIPPRNSYSRLDRYAFGYDNNNNKNRNHKILRFIDDHFFTDGLEKHAFTYQIFDFASNSWKVLDVTPEWNIKPYQRGVSLKGNAYFFAQEKIARVTPGGIQDFLLSFDFTSERFGPRLPLPFHSYAEDSVDFSFVREEKLLVLYQSKKFLDTMEIWVTTQIEHDDVSWRKFLRVDMKPLSRFQFDFKSGSFFIHEEKKLAVVFDLDGYKPTETRRYQRAHIIGEDGYYKTVNIKQATDLGRFGYTQPIYCVQLCVLLLMVQA
ncbi:unnamed protein product [Microthlaspi erraticum]|uniref:F-box associated beta-propeller type 1 domain-containing protein n=1 Tax=Microthlaspi erraticum TaxID=1685480 RepID=A0A6D2KZ06_9BRAS|nr:unnamed protein product [Microthlaspi erraticum]CAA7057393.1 unnamed protein product [Microthlaspi erraticum]